VDDADNLLNINEDGFFALFRAGHLRQENHEAAWLNLFLERNPATIVWITNRDGSIPESVRRRFHYSLHFLPLSARERQRLWNHILKNHPLKAQFDESYLRQLAFQFPVNAAGIQESLRSIQGLRKKLSREALRNHLEELLAARTRILTGRRPSGPKRNHGPHRSDLLRTDVDPAILATEVQRHLLQDGPASGLHLLFYGPPGTGKSQLIRKIAEGLGREIQIERASSLLDPYVGGTEQNIRAAFERAERGDRILLIDEADTFLLDRSGAHRSWESSMVNEILDAMENFSGVFVATTNRLDFLDPAALRRFRRKIHFKPLDGMGAAAMLETYVAHYFGRPGLHRFATDLERIGAVDGLTPGDFRVVFANLGSMEASAVHPGAIVAELQKERSFRAGGGAGRIGFRQEK
ncbi:MAG: AAA family ATPase, partial [Leptospiraceae bacterium]|nr:AAA family ATPase [Leptospiraceae bacterium]